MNPAVLLAAIIALSSAAHGAAATTVTSATQNAPSGFSAEIGGVKIELPSDWKALTQNSNSTHRVQARNAVLAIDMTAQVITNELFVSQYAAVMVLAATTNATLALDKLPKRVDLSRAEIEKAVVSDAGKTLSKQIKQSTRDFEFRDIFFQRVKRGKELNRQFDIHFQPGDKRLYRRDFLLRGNAPREIVQVTYTGPSQAVFTNKAIINSVRPR